MKTKTNIMDDNGELYATKREESVDEMLSRLLIPDSQLDEMMHEADELFHQKVKSVA